MKIRKEGDTISIKIRVSYNTDAELAGVIRLLSPAIKNWKIKPPKGRYKLAYIDMRGGDSTPVLVNRNAGKPAQNQEK